MSYSVGDKTTNCKPARANADHRVVDLRSDTVTKPTDAMRQAMASAVVGDDVMQEDPTVNRLEERCAQMFGKEAALFTPSACMSNLIAVMLHCEKWGSEIICGTRQHIFKYERGTYAHIARASCYGLPNLANGTMDIDSIRGAIRNVNDIHLPKTSLICLEDTHNVCGGKVLPASYYDQVRHLADEQQIAVHLDGSRIFNASVASGRSIDQICAPVDSVTMCLSKGIGAPAGAVLGGSRQFIDEARKLRKSLGGGMRQVGVLAAAAMIGLDTAPDRLRQDHINAKAFSSTLNSRHLPLKCDDPDTNIVFMRTGRTCATELEQKLTENGILSLALSDDDIRFVFHSDLTTDDVEHAIDVITNCVKDL